MRLYDRDFKLVVPPRKVTGGRQPFRIAFSPDGALLAVGYDDAATVDLLDGHSLAPLPGPNVDGLRNGNLSSSPGQRTAGRSTRAGDTGWTAGRPCSSLGRCGSWRASRFAEPAAIRSRAWRHCRMVGSWLLRKTRSWSYWNLTADLAGRTLRPMQTFEVK